MRQHGAAISGAVAYVIITSRDVVVGGLRPALTVYIAAGSALLHVQLTTYTVHPQYLYRLTRHQLTRPPPLNNSVFALFVCKKNPRA